MLICKYRYIYITFSEINQILDCEEIIKLLDNFFFLFIKNSITIGVKLCSISNSRSNFLLIFFVKNMETTKVWKGIGVVRHSPRFLELEDS